ncbi:MAG TPA: hypothetical protein CFH79_06050 [Sulfurospirillum sp. UBA11407]|nr:MAG TPA: hypothetical protein CFH79_06050 [Sulfurospirillum sp. UBA11407]
MENEQILIKRKKVKKYLFIFFVGFILLNSFIYWVEYRRYVLLAPSSLQEARKEFTKAIIPHMYYTFLVKTVRIDFQNQLLAPLKKIRNYFYHKGLEKLPPNEAEGALWFDLFEARLYNYSVRASYGSMAKHYGVHFAKDFIDKVYANIELLSKYPLADDSISELGGSVVETYLDLINIYVADFHLNLDGYTLSNENMKMISTNTQFHQRFVTLYEWEKEFLAYHKEHHPMQYASVMSTQKGWYSPYIKYYDKMYLTSSFILFYKIHNNHFSCDADKEYWESIEEAKQKILDFSQTYAVPTKSLETFKRQIAYLQIDNLSNANEQNSTSTNPLKLTINCNYKTNKEKQQ